MWRAIVSYAPLYYSSCHMCSYIDQLNEIIRLLYEQSSCSYLHNATIYSCHKNVVSYSYNCYYMHAHGLCIFLYHFIVVIGYDWKYRRLFGMIFDAKNILLKSMPACTMEDPPYSA